MSCEEAARAPLTARRFRRELATLSEEEILDALAAVVDVLHPPSEPIADDDSGAQLSIADEVRFWIVAAGTEAKLADEMRERAVRAEHTEQRGSR